MGFFGELGKQFEVPRLFSQDHGTALGSADSVRRIVGGSHFVRHLSR